MPTKRQKRLMRKALSDDWKNKLSNVLRSPIFGTTIGLTVIHPKNMEEKTVKKNFMGLTDDSVINDFLTDESDSYEVLRHPNYNSNGVMVLRRKEPNKTLFLKFHNLTQKETFTLS